MDTIKLTPCPIEGLYILEPAVYKDARGFFTETYNRRELARLGIKTDFVQDNLSRSVRGVLRGLHFQRRNPQAKLVRVSRGAVFDVAVDLRPKSATFGRWHGVELTEENRLQLYIPEGFAHGFLVLSDMAELCYKVGAFHDPSDECGLRWDDPKLGIDWPLAPGETPLLSRADMSWPEFAALSCAEAT